MLERAIIEFRNGFGEMQIIENGLAVRYRIEVTDDRQIASITTSYFQKTDDSVFYKNVGNVSEQTTFDQIKNDTSRTEMFRWFAHGVFGIPLQDK